MLGWPCGAEPSRTHGRRCGPDGSGRRLRPAFLRFCPIHVVRPGRLGFLQKHGALPVLVPASWLPVRNSPFVVLPGCAPAFLPGPALPPAPHECPLVPLGGINDPSSRSHNNIPSLAKSSGQQSAVYKSILLLLISYKFLERKDVFHLYVIFALLIMTFCIQQTV